MTREEQETIFRTDEAGKEWAFYSRSPRFKRLLERRGYRVETDHQGLWSCRLPAGALTIRSARQPKRKGGVFPKRPGPEATSTQLGVEEVVQVGGGE